MEGYFKKKPRRVSGQKRSIRRGKIQNVRKKFHLQHRHDSRMKEAGLRTHLLRNSQ